ncbi:hypothetical protein EV284_4322 [Streptomyces sp. BK022]|nr:hypothetical protein EV284_4322 [Streptomyces sp. BK022]
MLRDGITPAPASARFHASSVERGTPDVTAARSGEDQPLGHQGSSATFNGKVFSTGRNRLMCVRRPQRPARGVARRGACLPWVARTPPHCPGFPDEVSRVRRWTRDILRGSPLAEDAELILSELSANAILHTPSGQEYGSFYLAVAVSAQVVAVSVTDDGGTERPRRSSTRTRTPSTAGGWARSAPSPTGLSSTTATKATRSPRSSTQTRREEVIRAESGNPPRLLVRVLDRGPHRAAGAGTPSILRCPLGIPGRPMGGGGTPHDLTGFGPGRFGRGVGVAARRSRGDQKSPTAVGVLQGVSHTRRHPRHLDHPTGDVPTANSPNRAPALRPGVQTPIQDVPSQLTPKARARP